MKCHAIAAAVLLCSGLTQAAEIPTMGSLPESTATMSAPQEPSVTLDELLHPVSAARTGVSDLRTQMLTEAGRTVGFRGGMAARARALAHALKAREAALDAMYQFAPLISQNGALPPVIVEARDVAAFAQDQIRTATRVYKIEKAERFVSVPPTWREYLLVGLPLKSGVDLPTLEARPKDGKEEAIWREAVKAGWESGQKQADAILTANFNRLARDYTGMVRYSTLLQQGMVSTTHVAQAQQVVTAHDGQLIVGDTLRRITAKAAFEADASKWRPMVAVEQAPALNLPKDADAKDGHPTLASTFSAIAIRDAAEGRIEIRFGSAHEGLHVTDARGNRLESFWNDDATILSLPRVHLFALRERGLAVEVARAPGVQYHFQPGNALGLERVFEDDKATYLVFEHAPKQVSVFSQGREGYGELKDKYYKFNGIADHLSVMGDGQVVEVDRRSEVRFYERPLKGAAQ